jgi:hypothetical protein
LFARIPATISKLTLSCQTNLGTLAALTSERSFDTIIYIDVLEHIEHDKEELALASKHLRPNGRLIVLSPAHQWLYSPFDKAIGHFRRYTKNSLRRLEPPGLVLQQLRCLDAVGMLASLANRLLLKKSLPALKDILFWDRWLVPCSEIIDPLFGFCVGKTIFAVWHKPQVIDAG